MKTNFTLLQLILPVLLVLSACTPAKPAPTLSPTTSAPVLLGDCILTPHDFQRMGIPIPNAMLVNIWGSDELGFIGRDGTMLGTWQTSFLIPHTNTHIFGHSGDPIESITLIYFSSDEDGAVHLIANQDGQITTLMDFPHSVITTGLIGVPTEPVVAYSTVETTADGSGLRSQIYLGDFQTIAAVEPSLTMDNSEARIALPVAIHRDLNNTPDGLWYTTSLWGIGGDSMTDPRAGLYYLDLATGESLEFLGMGCNFSDLSVSQSWAAWTANGVLYAADLHTGDNVTFPRLAGNDRGPAHAFIGPGDGYLAWLEGKGSEWDGTLETTVRIGTLEGYIIGEYPLSGFVAPSGLGEGIALRPLGWMMSENLSLVLAVYNASTDRAILLSLDANTGQITRLAEGNFVGFGYP